MEQRGYLSSHEDSEGQGGRRRRVYWATAAGKKGLALARKQLRELVGEVGGRDVA
jgi:DNA-binding PadR family transcriptional regulator